MTKKRGSLMKLLLLMKGDLGKILFSVLCVIIVNLSELLKPYVTKIVIDDFLVGRHAQDGIYSIAGLGGLYFAIALISALLSMTQVRIIARVSQNILNRMRSAVFHNILRMPMKRLDAYGTGRLITRATNDVETINEFYSDVFINTFKDVFLLIGIVAAMVLMDPALSLIAMTGVPLILLITFSVKKVIKENFKRMKTIIGQINGFFSENVAGMRLVQAFNKEADKLSEFLTLNAAYFKTTKTQVLLNTFLRPTMEVINTLVIALLILFGYHRMSGGMLELGVLYAFTNYVKQFFGPIDDLAEKYTTIQSALVSTDRVYEILDEPDLEALKAGGHSSPVRGELEFRNVWFAYNNEDWVLRDVSFKVAPGQRVAFVGATGVGKSTIISLVSRYYTVQRGTVLIDGIPVEDWDLLALRRGVCTMLQDVFLFTGTIGENIDMHAGLTHEQIRLALETAGAESFVGELGGIKARVSEQGLNFSTGQRQLLSFARAIAHDPAILVLDEATAHIDTNTEDLLTRSIEQISEGRTSILIAHRLSTIRSCDVIFVLVGGRIVEQGTHAELSAAEGPYASLIRAQLER